MRAICLCLDKRKTEWEDLSKQCQNIGIEFEPFVVGNGYLLDKYDYIDEESPDVSRWIYGNPSYKKHHYNAFMAHKEIIKRAKSLKLKEFLMLEDDAYITNRFQSVFERIKDNPVFQTADLFYFGWWIGDENDSWNQEIEYEYNKAQVVSIRKASRLGGLHAALIRESMYDYILSLPPINPIDSQLNEIHHKMKSYYLTPKIIHIKNIYSFCEGCTIKRNII